MSTTTYTSGSGTVSLPAGVDVVTLTIRGGVGESIYDWDSSYSYEFGGEKIYYMGGSGGGGTVDINVVGLTSYTYSVSNPSGHRQYYDPNPWRGYIYTNVGLDGGNSTITFGDLTIIAYGGNGAFTGIWRFSDGDFDTIYMEDETGYNAINTSISPSSSSRISNNSLNTGNWNDSARITVSYTISKIFNYVNGPTVSLKDLATKAGIPTTNVSLLGLATKDVYNRAGTNIGKPPTTNLSLKYFIDKSF